MSAQREFASLLFVLAALLFAPRLAQAEASVRFGPNDVRSVFHVAKSENQNQVHYGLRLDASCRPVGKRPVFAYWSRYRATGRVDAPLEGLGTRFYGASDEQKVRVGSTGGQVQMYVKALERVRVDITIERTANGCAASATTTIQGERASLTRAYLQLGRFGLSVKYVDLLGTRVRDRARVVQRLES